MLPKPTEQPTAGQAEPRPDVVDSTTDGEGQPPPTPDSKGQCLLFCPRCGMPSTRAEFTCRRCGARQCVGCSS